MTDLRLDAAAIERAIADMLASYPELADDEELRAGMLEGSTALYDVLERALDIERDAASIAAAIGLRQGDLAIRKARHEYRQQAMRALILKLMERANLPTIRLPEATLSITHRKPEPVVVDETQLPECCFKTTRTVSKSAIKEVWKENGLPPPGTELNNGSTSLAIRSK